jgi:uncharacterized membrane protein YjjP (DUF1212 family)
MKGAASLACFFCCFIVFFSFGVCCGFFLLVFGGWWDMVRSCVIAGTMARYHYRPKSHVEYSVAAKTTTWYALSISNSAARRVIAISSRRGLDMAKTLPSAP